MTLLADIYRHNMNGAEGVKPSLKVCHVRLAKCARSNADCQDYKNILEWTDDEFLLPNSGSFVFA